MPSIPSYLLQENLPSRSGIPAITPGVPAVATPDAPLGASQLVGGGIAQLGGSFQQAGQLLAATADIEAKARAADDLLRSKKTGLDVAPSLAAMLDTESQNEDYSTLPERIMAEGKRIVAEGGQNLSGRARELYDIDMKEKVNAYYQKGIDLKRVKREATKDFVTAGQFKESEQALYDAPTIYHELVAKDALEVFGEQMVTAGMYKAGEMRTYLDGLYEKAAVQKTQRAIRQNPDGALVQLQGLIDGKPAAEDFPVPPGQYLVPLRDEALAQSKALVQAAEHAERVAEWRSGQAGQAIEQDYRSKISVLDPTPANLPKLRQLLDTANTPEQRKALGTQAHQEITTLLRGTINIALGEEARQREAAGKPQDDPSVEYDIRMGIALAKTPDELRAMEARLLQAGYAKRLKPETFSTLEARIAERRNQASPTNRSTYRAGVDFIKRALIIPGGFGEFNMGAKEREQLLVALDDFEKQYRTVLDKQGVDAVDLAAPEIAETVRFSHFPPVKESMPAGLRDATNEAEAGHALEEMRVSGMHPAQITAYKKMWQKMQDDLRQEREYQEKVKQKTDVKQRLRPGP